MNKKIFFIISVGALLVLAALLGATIGQSGSEAASSYSAVYLTTGDIYFGKLSWFPSPRLTDVWFIQRSVDAENQSQLNLLPFSSSFWGPMNEVHLNPKQIVLWARLKAGTDISRALADPNIMRQLQTPQAPTDQQNTVPSQP